MRVRKKIVSSLKNITLEWLYYKCRRKKDEIMFHYSPRNSSQLYYKRGPYTRKIRGKK
jgi:hypothetical protein